MRITMKVSLWLAATMAAASACSRTDIFADALPVVSISPVEATVGLGRSLQFTAVTVPSERSVVWSVEPAGVGTIDALGQFTAPAQLEKAPFDVVVRASVEGSPEATATAQVSIVALASNPPSSISAFEGDGAEGLAGERLESNLVAKVADAAGGPVAGVRVEFTLDGWTAGAITDAQGLARAAPLLPTTAGPTTATASIDALEPARFRLTARPGPAAAIAATHPTGRGHPGTTLDEPVSVVFRDRFGNVVPGANAVVTAPDGATAVALAVGSDDQGRLDYAVTLAPVAGAQTFGFALPQDPSALVSLVFTAVGRDAATLSIVDGDAQSVVVGSVAASALRVMVRDVDGYPAANAVLEWVSPDGATLVSAAAAPEADGTAAAVLKAPTTAGPIRIECRVKGTSIAPATFLARIIPGAARRLQLLSGTGQSTTAGSTFGAAFAVRASDAYSNGVDGVEVTFSALEGGGSIDPVRVTTSAGGLAQASMLAGTVGQQKYRAEAGGLIGSPVEVTGTAVAGGAGVLSIVSGQSQAGAAGARLAQPLVVRLTQNGAPVRGASVSFGVVLGDGSVLPSIVTTAPDGTAQAFATLGTQVGPERFSASVPGAIGSPLFFDARATSAPVVLFRAVSGSGQTAVPGGELAQPLVVEALDGAGRGVAGLTVNFASAEGGRTTPADATTDGAGRASVKALLGAGAGAQTFTATLSGSNLSPVSFSALSVPLTGNLRLRVDAGGGQSAEVGQPLATPMQVTVTGPGGTGVAGIEVTFAADAEGATVDPAKATTDAQGHAETRLTLGRTVGTQRFRAAADGVLGSPAVLDATALLAPPERLLIVSGDGQSARVGSPLAQPLVVRAVDRVGNGLSNVRVAWAAGVGGGSATPSGPATDGAGTVTATATLGPSSGAQTFVATSPGLEPVTFTAFAEAAVDRLSISPAGAVLAPGSSLRYVATAIYTDGSSRDVTAMARWSSTNAGVLSVGDTTDTKGIGRAVAAGRATVTATYAGSSTTTEVTVESVTLRSVVVLPPTASVLLGSTTAFRANGVFSNGSVTDVTESAAWATSAGTIASVSDAAGSKGVVRGLALGGATITATLNGVSGSRAATVVQAPLQYLEITPPNVSQPAGTGYTFSATATYANGVVEDVTDGAVWSSSDPTLMTVQSAPAEAGRATFLAAGQPEVRATWQGVTASRRVVITTATVRSLTLAPRQVALSVRDILQLRAIATYTDGTVTDVAHLATWSTSAPAVLDVSNAAGSRGLLSALSAGSATITARLAGQTASISATVNGASVQAIRVMAGGRGAARCPKGGELQLRAAALYSNGQTADISDQASWSVSNNTLASIGQGDQGGRVVCLAEGTFTATAAFNGRSGTLDITVTPATLTSITLAPNTVRMARNDLRAFFAKGIYSDGTNRDLTTLASWSSADNAIVTVSNASGFEGRANAVNAGATTISASYQGVTGTASITVTTATLSLIVVSPANPVVRMRDRFVQFNATAVYSDGTTQDVTEQAQWTASDPQVALVSNAPDNIGWVALQGSGSCNVTAQYGDKMGTTTLTVR